MIGGGGKKLPIGGETLGELEKFLLFFKDFRVTGCWHMALSGLQG